MDEVPFFFCRSVGIGPLLPLIESVDELVPDGDFTKEDIDTLKALRADLSEETCSVCLEPVRYDETRVLSCNHAFHSNCITKWFEKTNTCPMCREVQEDVPLPDSEYVHFPFFSEVRIELHLDGEIYYVGDTGLLTRRGETPTFFHPEQLEVTGSATFSRVEDDSHS